VTWTRQTGPRISYLESVAYGKGVYVTVGDSLTILTSSNGVDWLLTTPLDGVEVGNELEAVTFANGIFLVVGNDGLILSSPDGYNWTQRYSGFSSRNLRSVIYANGVFTTVGNNDTILQSGNILPRLTGLMRPDGFELTVQVEPGCVWSVEASTNFTNWVPVATVTNLQFSHAWVDHQATNCAQRFYRLTSP
jgi:hypothetical protein